MIEYPGDNAVRDAAKQLGLDQRPELVLRDLARLVEITQLWQREVGATLVLAGGLAMRCYSSTRFTIKDVDTSARRLPVNREDLEDCLTYNDEVLTIHCGPRKYWDQGRQLFTAIPIRYAFHKGGIVVPDRESSFSLSVSERGLELPPLLLGLPQFYEFDLRLPKVDFAVMDKVEIVAEKSWGAAAYGLQKHFADIAYLVGRYHDELAKRTDDLHSVANAKLQWSRKSFPNDYRRFPDLRSLKPALRDICRTHPLFASEWPETVRYLGGEPLTFDAAYERVHDGYLPLLP